MSTHLELLLPLLLSPSSYDIAGLLSPSSFDYADMSIYQIGDLYPAKMPSPAALAIMLDALNLPHPILHVFNLQEALFNRYIYANHSIIYIWLNSFNGKVYIGSAQQAHERTYEHLKFPGQSNVAFQRAIRKYGIGAFMLIIAYDLGLAITVTKVALLAMEQVYLDCVPVPLKYNFATIAGSTAGTTHIVTPETRAKIALGLLKAGRAKSVIFTDRNGIEHFCQSHRAGAIFANISRNTLESHVDKGTTFVSRTIGPLTVRHLD